MIDLGVPKLIITENVNIKIFEKTYGMVIFKDEPRLKSNSYLFKINLKRFAANDLYSIYAQYDGNVNKESFYHLFFGHSLVNIINNKIKLEKYFISGEKDYFLNDGKLVFHHSEVIEKFRNTKYLFNYLKSNSTFKKAKNILYGPGNKQIFHKLSSYASFLNFKNIFKNHKLNTTDVVKMSFIKNVNFGNHINYLLRKSNATKSQYNVDYKKFYPQSLIETKVITPNISYSNFYIKFKKLNPLKHNLELATIYWEPNNKNDIFSSDFMFQDNSYIEINNKKYKLLFQESQNLKKSQNLMTTGQIIEVGKLILPEFTTYNYEKNKVTTDINEYSSKGLLLPFNFRGNFFYKLHIGINEVFKNMSFNIYQHIEQKHLDPYEGKIKIKIILDNFKFNSEITHDIFNIHSNLFNKIIDLGELINPLAIVRFSNNEEEETHL